VGRRQLGRARLEAAGIAGAKRGSSLALEKGLRLKRHITVRYIEKRVCLRRSASISGMKVVLAAIEEKSES